MAFQASPPGQDQASGSEEALFLKKYAGELIVAYNQAVKIAPHVTRKRVSGQKSASFPVIGTTTANYHTRGEDILTEQGDATDGSSSTADYLKQFIHSEKEVFVDDLVVSPVFISELDEMKLHYSVREPYARKQANSLAEVTDTNLLRTIINGAGQANGPLGASYNTQIPGGNSITSANAGTDGGALLEAIKDLAEAFDIDKVPEEGRFCALKPAQYYLLVENQDLLNRQFGGQNGVFSEGTVFKAWGMTLIKTNLVPTDSGVTSGAVPAGERGTTYSDVDCSNTVAVAWHPDGVGSVSLMDVQTEMWYEAPRQGHVMLAKMSEGHDFLMTPACGLIKTA